MTFSAPLMLVRMHSVGLYSDAGTCFIAAAWMTKSTPRSTVRNTVKMFWLLQRA